MIAHEWSAPLGNAKCHIWLDYELYVQRSSSPKALIAQPRAAPEGRATLIEDVGVGRSLVSGGTVSVPTSVALSAVTSSFRCEAVCAEFLPMLSLLRHSVRIGLPGVRPDRPMFRFHLHGGGIWPGRRCS